MRLLETLQAMDRNLIFSGQLFLREQGPAMSLDMTKRKLFATAGIIAVPEHIKLLGEHQYSLGGYHSGDQGIILGLDEAGYDMKNRARGKNIGGLLLEPIWKI